MVPTLFSPPDPNAFNAAAVQGYDVKLAYLATALWSIVVFFACWATGTQTLRQTVPPKSAPILWKEASFVFILVVLLHWPPFLARYGHYGEDNYFFSVLSRMQDGQRPFVDFEFIYGPLMITPAHAWMQVFGFSMQAYYWLYAILQGAFFTALILTLQRFVPEPRRRIFIFTVLCALSADMLLGLNWIGWRRFLSVFAILIVAANPRSLKRAALAGMLIAAHLAISFEYAFAGLAGCCAICGLMLAKEREKAVFVAGLTLIATTVLGALTFIALCCGDIGQYFAALKAVLTRASALNLGAFKFYWTVNSLAAVAALSLSVVAIGSGLPSLRQTAPSEGDRLLLAALAFCLISLKVALQRADVYHFVTPFFPLGLALLAGPPLQVFAIDSRLLRVGKWLIVVVAATNIVGVAPIGMAHAQGWLRGGMDMVLGRPAAGPVLARTYSVESERTHPVPELVQLAAYLARSDMRERPVFLYGRAWWLNAHIGVRPLGYLNYEWMYGDATHPVQDVLAKSPNALIIMPSANYDSLMSGHYVQEKPSLDWIRRLGMVLSTVHYEQSPIEKEIKDRMWKAKVGIAIAKNHTEWARFGNYVVVGPIDAQRSENHE